MLSLKTYLSQPRLLGIALLKRASFLFSDAMYLRILYRLHMGKRLHLKNPVTFNEKLQWLKLYNRNPLYTRLVDKLGVKQYIAETIGEEYVIPTIGVWDRVEDIDFEALPNQFVLKTTHGGGGTGVVICRDKSTFDREAAKRKLKESMSYNIYHDLKEWPYKDVKPRIIAEQYIADEAMELLDYKLFCFNGMPQLLKVDFNRFIKHQANYYDLDWNLLECYEVDFPSSPDKHFVKPLGFDKMVELATCLAQDIPFVRIDLYQVNGKIYFGEMTFFPASGLGLFVPKEYDNILGRMLTLPSSK